MSMTKRWLEQLSEFFGQQGEITEEIMKLGEVLMSFLPCKEPIMVFSGGIIRDGNGNQVGNVWPTPIPLQDFRLAPSGEGSLAAEWKDKPHRLVYDLVGEVERLHTLLRGTPL